MSFADVLPTEPVIPTTRHPSSRRHARRQALERGQRVVGGQDPARAARAVPSEEASTGVIDDDPPSTGVQRLGGELAAVGALAL